MSKKNKRKTDKVKIKADEVVRIGPIQLERYGKYIRMKNVLTPDQQEAFLLKSKEAFKKTLNDLGDAVLKLQNLVKQYSPLSIMYQAAYMVIPIFIKCRSENEIKMGESSYLAAIEYLQYIIARTEFDNKSRELSKTASEEIWEQTKRVFELTQHYIFTRPPSKDLPLEIENLRFDIDMRRLMVRVKRYPIYFSDSLKTFLTPYNPWIEKTYGISVEEIILGLEIINNYQKSGIRDKYVDTVDTQDKLMTKLVEKGYSINAHSTSNEIERAKQALELPEFKPLYDQLNEKLQLTSTPVIFDITDISKLPKNFLSLLSIKPSENILTVLMDENHEDLSPLSTSILHSKPFMEIDERFYTFYHSGFEDRIAEIIETDLFQRLPYKLSMMDRRMSDHIEQVSKELLISVIKPNFVFENIFYPNPDEPGGLTELDILLKVDNILFLVEVKSGRFSGGASRGAPKDLVRKIHQLILEGQRQSDRAERYIKSVQEALFFDESGKNVVCKILQADYRLIFRIVITREDLGWIGAQLAILSVLDKNLNTSFPWHVSLDDLRVVVDLFKGNEICFIHYLEQRLAATSKAVLSQSDEVEHIALYHSMNLYHILPMQDVDQMTFDTSFMRNIDHFFMEMSEGKSPVIPEQSMPPNMKRFINGLRDSHLANRFELGSLVLSLDENSRNELQNGLVALDSGIQSGKRRSLRIPIAKEYIGFSITNVDDNNWKEELIISAAQMHQSNCNRWIVVKLVCGIKYSVEKIEIISKSTFNENELTSGKLHIEARTKKRIIEEKPGRNDLCPCGSGKKYKRCHGN